MKIDFTHIKKELFAHLPYSVFSAIIGLIVVGIFYIFLETDKFIKASNVSFHLCHFTHLLFSVTATTAMILRHEKKYLKAIIIGIVGSIPLCGISDILIPFLGGELLKSKMTLHICLIEHFQSVFFFVIIGTLLGIIMQETIKKTTFFSHSVHVLISSIASILYLISFGLCNWIDKIGQILIIVIIAVLFPCCLSDIIFPLLFVKKELD